MEQPDATDTGPPELQQIRRGVARKLVIVMVFAVVVYAGLVFYGDADALLQSAEQVSASVLLAAWGLATSNFVVRFLRWEYYVRRLGVRIPVSESVLVYLSGLSMALTPVRAGEVLKSLLLKANHDLPIARTAPVLVAERVTDVGALVLLSSLGALEFDRGAVYFAVGAAGVGLLLLLCAFPPVGELLLTVLGRVGPTQRFVPKIRTAYETLWTLTGPTPFVVGLAMGVLAWGLQCGCLFVVAGAFSEMQLTFSGSLLTFSAPLLAGTLAMLPGGLGLTEASMAAALVELGGPHATAPAAAAITLTVRLLALWWSVALGFAALGLWRTRYGAAPARDAAAVTPTGGAGP